MGHQKYLLIFNNYCTTADNHYTKYHVSLVLLEKQDKYKQTSQQKTNRKNKAKVKKKNDLVSTFIQNNLKSKVFYKNMSCVSRYTKEEEISSQKKQRRITHN